jgi:hypothetical protein
MLPALPARRRTAGRLQLEWVVNITPESPAEFIGMRSYTPTPKSDPTACVDRHERAVVLVTKEYGMFWREPGLFVLFGLILIVIGELVRVTYPIIGETLWWIGMIAAMAGAIVDLRRKHGGTR